MGEGEFKVTKRESGGSIGSNRSDFQKNRAIWLLLELHSKLNDYLLVFELNDDILVFDTALSPKNISCYQVKTASKKWSLSDLVRQGKKTNSIVGNLYSNLKNISPSVSAINFESNMGFVFGEDASKADSQINPESLLLIQMLQEDRNKIRKQIEKEYAECDLVFEKLTRFEKIPISVEDTANHTVGKISEFLNKRMPERPILNPELLFRMLFDEVSRKSDYEGKDTDLENIRKKKSIGPEILGQALDFMATEKDFGELWRSVESRLNSEGIPLQKITRIRQAWIKMQIELLNPSNVSVKSINSKIGEIVRVEKANDEEITLTLLLDKTYKELVKGSVPRELSESDILALILRRAYGES